MCQSPLSKCCSWLFNLNLSNFCPGLLLFFFVHLVCSPHFPFVFPQVHSQRSHSCACCCNWRRRLRVLHSLVPNNFSHLFPFESYFSSSKLCVPSLPLASSFSHLSLALCQSLTTLHFGHCSTCYSRNTSANNQSVWEH